MSIFMKIVVKLFLVAAVLVMCGNAASAQKFGTINVQELLMAMPDRDSAIVKLQKFEEELGSQMEAMQVELNTKYLDYQKTQDSLTPTMRPAQRKRIGRLSTSYARVSTDGSAGLFQNAARSDDAGDQ